ncbi:MAG: hypothetical protein IJK08_04320 [Prevotella sp.]|nr:hypothetical protein [Prevotella sp.]
MDILFNKKGVPLMFTCGEMGGETFTDAAIRRNMAQREVLQVHDNWAYDYVHVGNHKVVSWGKANQFPQWAAKLIKETTVLNTGLQYLLFLMLGQGIFGCRVVGINDDGSERVEPIDDPRLSRFLESRVVRKYMEKVLRDYLKFGNGAVQFVPTMDLRAMQILNPLNALWYRYTEPDSFGSQECVVSGWWPVTPQEKQYHVLPVLREVDPEGHADLLKAAGKMPNGFVYPVRDSWSNEEIYCEPRWWPAWVAGWVDIAHLVPTYLKKAYKNQTTWKWHVQIPYSYWEKKFPPNDYTNPEDRKKAIQGWMDAVERNLIGPDNAEKPLFTNYAVNEMNGRVEEEWKITPLANKYTGNENLVTSSAANSEILFALMVNPNVMGAGMPGGAYSLNQGGSNIREAFLVNLANAWKDRQQLLDPLELYIRMNGLPECQLRYRSTILTTLDTGAGTAHTLS